MEIQDPQTDAYSSHLGKAILTTAAVSAAAFVGTAVARITTDKYLNWVEKKNRKPFGFVK